MLRSHVRAELPVKIVLRTTEYETPRSFFDRVNHLDRVLEAFRRRRYLAIDTIYEYPLCLTLTGRSRPHPTSFHLRTVTWKGRSTKPIITSANDLPLNQTINAVDGSPSLLGTEEFCTVYLTNADLHPSITLEEVCHTVNTLYHQGNFSKFGLSNLTASQVLRIHKICVARGWIRPSVYQGRYDPGSPSGEDNLISILHDLEIGFEVHCLLTQESWRQSSSLSSAVDAVDIVQHMQTRIVSCCQAEEADKFSHLDKLAVEPSFSALAMTLRWPAWQSALHPDLGDAIVFQASNISRLIEALTMLESGRLQHDSPGRLESHRSVLAGDTGHEAR